jgi:hypothetical protein
MAGSELTHVQKPFFYNFFICVGSGSNSNWRERESNEKHNVPHDIQVQVGHEQAVGLTTQLVGQELTVVSGAECLGTEGEITKCTGPTT